MDRRFSWIASLDPTSEADASRFAAALSEEYRTLAAHRERLLNEHSGEYVVISGGDWHTFPTLAEASEWGHTHVTDAPFFLGRVEPHLMDAYLGARRHGGVGA